MSWMMCGRSMWQGDERGRRLRSMSMLSVLQGLIRRLGLSVLLVAASTAATAARAELYMASFDRAVWQVEKSAISCRLHQTVPKYGTVVFETLAGSPLRFYAKVEQNPMRSGPSTLIANPPSWNSERAAQPLGHVEVVDGRQPIQLDEEQAQRLLQALRDGLVPELARPATEVVKTASGVADETAQLSLSPVNFQRAYSQYQDCIAQMLPFSLEQMANTSIGFELDRVDLDAAARKKIDVLLRYLRADRRPLKIEIYAFSDDSYRRVENLELAKLRAQCINDYLVAHGIEQNLIHTNYRTERRGRNVSKRYVTIRWQRRADIARR